MVVVLKFELAAKKMDLWLRRKEGRKEGREEGRKEGRKDEGRKERKTERSGNTGSRFWQ